MSRALYIFINESLNVVCTERGSNDRFFAAETLVYLEGTETEALPAPGVIRTFCKGESRRCIPVITTGMEVIEVAFRSAVLRSGIAEHMP